MFRRAMSSFRYMCRCPVSYSAPRQINVCQLQFGGQLFLRHTLGDSQSTQPRAELLVNLMIHTIILLLFWCKYVWILSVRSCKIAPI